ncbi:peptidylprolyl isomerase [Ructibacterium gallinarum]|uniref:Peptidylprolyl isomerase n=1 Tax=Ructibacterium gallinarum TaxID=2779355 RepID=A0A9D5M6H3_9FIRM|nr:peptidylprolyl isomerase [Ructibacterium gallinarum]MBE5040444.1 peptidylprolyl isomerase [Ructibacterium gallinarum]
MENENKDLKGTPEENSMQDKVREDLDAKLAEAAAEVQDEIDSAASQEQTEDGDTFAGYEANGEMSEIPAEGEDDSWSDEAFIEPPKEPKKVTMTVSSLVLSLIGTAVVGALVLFLCLRIPVWIENMPEGKKIASVDGTEITDLDMKYYIYQAAMEYYQNDTATSATTPTEYDWDQTGEDGKKASDIVKDNALDAAIGEVLLMNAGDKNGVEWNEEEALMSAQTQNQQLIALYGEELVELNAKAQGLESIKQYNRKIVQYEHIQAVESDMEKNPSKYYPEDTSVLDQYTPDDKASVKHILIKTDDTASNDTEAAEGEEAAPAEDKRAKAEEILNRAKSGEDFDALMEEFNEDTGETEAGYTFGPGEMMPAFEEAAFKLKLNEISDLVETSYGYHIIKRIPGKYELEGYWKEQAKIKVNESMMEKMSVKDILTAIETAANDFQTKYAEQQGTSSSSGSSSSSSSSGQ